MARRVLWATALGTTIVGAALLAGPFSGSWLSEVGLGPGPNLFESLGGLLTMTGSFGGFVSSSDSQFLLPGGFVWQGFDVTGRLGAVSVRADLLFGPSTNEFVYAEEIVSLSVAGVDFAAYWACLGGAVLGGPAEGFAVRAAGHVSTVEVVSVTEFGARIEDEDFDGITIYHAATGLCRSYVTNPLVPTQTPPGRGGGWTGEKITVSGPGFGCIGRIVTTAHLTQAGFDFLKITLFDVDLGLSWLESDVTTTLELRTERVAVTPEFHLGTTACLAPCLEVLTGAPNVPFPFVTGISLYGIGLEYAWGGVRVKDLTVFDAGRYAITTPEYGSKIEEVTEALEKGHEYYPDYGELLSIEVSADVRGGRAFRSSMAAYFERHTGVGFEWGAVCVEAHVPLGACVLSGSLVASRAGLDRVGITIELPW